MRTKTKLLVTGTIGYEATGGKVPLGTRVDPLELLRKVKQELGKGFRYRLNPYTLDIEIEGSEPALRAAFPKLEHLVAPLEVRWSYSRA